MGQHEVRIDDEGLVERSEFVELIVFWKGVDRIAETENHAFIYVSSVSACIIPKQSVTDGNPSAFIARAKELWFAANPKAEDRAATRS